MNRHLKASLKLSCHNFEAKLANTAEKLS